MTKSKRDEEDEGRGYDAGDVAAGMLIAATAAAIGVAAVLLPSRRRAGARASATADPAPAGLAIDVEDLNLDADDVPTVGRSIN